MKRLALLTAALGLAAGSALNAQSNDNAVIDRANQSGLPPEHPPVVSGGQSDIATQTDSGDAGVQRVAETRSLPFKISVAADLQVYYTDNVLLATDNSTASNSDAVVVGGTISVRATGNPVALDESTLTPSIGLVYQNFRHGVASDDTARDDLDFDAYSVPATLTYRFGEGWEATAGVTASAVYRIHGVGDYKRIIASITPSVSLRKIIPISQTQVVVVTGSVGHAFTKATLTGVPLLFTPFRDDRNDRTDYALDVTYYLLRGKWTLTPYARVNYGDYDHYEEAGLLAPTTVNRNDVTASAGLAVSYALNAWSSARLFTSYEVRDSDPAGPFDYSYKAGSIGLGATLSFSF